MKLIEAHVDRFGTWRDLTLPTDSTLSVFYGPNAAGKTTLMRFLRGMLYGFPPNTEENSGGKVGIQHAGQELRIERRVGNGRQQLAVTGGNRIGPAEESLRELLGGVSAEVFANLFAIGLPELQRLATLGGDAISDAIYGVSLAPEGRKLVNAIQAADDRQRELFNEKNRTGQLAELLELDREFDAEIQSLSTQRDDYEQLDAHRRTLAANVDEMIARKQGMHSQLRGHRFMEHVCGPWRQVREYQESLNRLPDASRFPTDGMARLAKWNERIDSERRCRDVLKEEAKELRNRAKSLTIDVALLKHAAEIRLAATDRGQFAEATANLQECERTVDKLREHYAQALGDLGGEWTTERLDAVDTSPETQFQLLDAARAYQAAAVRRGRFRRMYKRLSDVYRKQRARSAEQEQQPGGKSPEDAIAEAKQALVDSDERTRLEREESELNFRAEAIHKELSIAESKEVMPRWFFWVLVFLASAGGLAFVLGLSTALTSSAMAGLTLALAGLTGIGVAWGLKLQGRGQGRENEQKLRAEFHAIVLRLDEIKQSKPEPSNDESDQHDSSTPASSSNQTVELAERIAELNNDVATAQRQQARRRRLVDLRGRIPRRQQAVTEARQKWCEALKRAGLPENEKLEESFNLWQHVSEIVEIRKSLVAAQMNLERELHRAKQLQNRLATLGDAIGDPIKESDDPLGKVDDWNARLEQAIAARDERRKLQIDFRTRRKEADQYSKQLFLLKQKRLTIFAQAGATDEEQFEQLAASQSNRAELEELLEIAEDELREAAATEPELAVVEEDLIAFDSAGNSDCIRMLELEMGEIESDLNAAHEELGRVKQALEELASDRRLSKLRYEQARVRESLQQTMEEWFGIQLAKQALDTVRARYERGRQPKVLAGAAEYFKQLTSGQYRNLWTPLGQRKLFVDDEEGHTRTVEQLSGGTREQLFLAIRLSMIDDYRERGIELPVVLDDVFVNFDEVRTDAALATLHEAAQRGQQILFFTCHRHLADRFGEKGCSVVNLPDLAVLREERRAG